MIRAVIFDLDGLLIDSKGAWNETDRILLEKRGIRLTEEVLRKVHGTGQKESIEAYKKYSGLEGDTKELIKERREIFYNLVKNDLRILDGGEEIVRKLSKDFILAIATGGHKKEKVLEILSKFNLATYFPIIVSSDEVLNGKPSPDIYFYTAKKLGVEPKECLVLEDAPNGAIAGKRAGMVVFGVNKDGKIREKLKEAGADKVFSNLKEIELLVS